MPTSYRSYMIRTILVALLFLAWRVQAEDWPTYQHDIARSGVTKEEIKPPLSEAWSFTPLHSPAPAWGDPQPKPVEGNLELPRVKFDDAFYAVSAGDSVYFGSSSDNTVYCLDAATGTLKWTKITSAPIRLAPTVWEGKLYVCSDDGHAYCLDAKNGREIWKLRAGPTNEKVLGHGRMISMWPLRTGILVDKGVAYFAAGVFPHEGLFLYAVDAATGKRIWVNDSFGWRTTRSISPQGYLLASSSSLFIPSGRAAPMGFRREDGQYLFQSRGNWRGDGLFGGTYALLAEGKLYSGTEQVIAYDQETGGAGFAWFHGRRLIVTSDTSYMLTGAEMSAIDRTLFPAASQKRQKVRRKRWKLDYQAGQLKRELRKVRRKAEKDPKAAKQLETLEKKMADLKVQLDAQDEAEKEAAKQVMAAKKWRIECDCTDSMILAGGILYAGGQDKVIAVEAATGRKLWTGKVKGAAKGLAVANGRLFASTDSGAIYCLVPGDVAEPRRVVQEKSDDPYPSDDRTKACAALADTIVKGAKIRKGYGLVIGAGDGRLAYELAKRTDLILCGSEKDDAGVAQARKALAAAGLCGARVCIDQGDLADLCYPDYFANLIVCEDPKAVSSVEEVARILKPCGGVAYLPKDLHPQVKALKHPEIKVAVKGDWLVLTRGALPGAGKWTQQFADPANTGCSDDERLKGPLGILWFGEPGPGRMPSRHASAAAPLAMDGRLFIQGENFVSAYDAYNGVELWTRNIEGAIRLGTKQECGNLAVSEDGLFVAAKDQCLRLDVATGKTIKTYGLPRAQDDKPRRWGYVAVVGNTLFGSATRGRVTSDTLFALSVKTGRPRWVHHGSSMMHISMCVGDGKVFLMEGAVTDEQRKSIGAEKNALVRVVMALDAKTGKLRWQKPVDLTDCVKVGIGSGDAVTVIYKDKVLLLCMVPWNGHFWKEFFAGDFTRRSIIALSSDTGKNLWSDHIGYRSRPLVIGDTIYAEPWAHNLHTGKPKMRVHPLTGKKEKWQIARPGHHCGCMAAGPNVLMFRSDSIAYYDLIKDQGTANSGGQRTSCWVNFIAANGLLQVPEGSSGCMCPFPIHCTIVFHPRKIERSWGRYSCPGPETPVKHMAVNLGAPGDRRDGKGTLWLSYPRPYAAGPNHRLVLQLNVSANILDGGGYYDHNAGLFPVEGTETPWVFSSGCVGLQQCTALLVGKGEPPGKYTVKLGFAELTHGSPGRRVFDIKLQGRTVAKDFDVFKAAGGKCKAVVKAFEDIEVADNLKIELVPKQDRPEPERAPILSSIEVTRTRTVPLSMAAPPFLLSDYQTEQTQTARVINLTDEEFVGKLQVTAPKGMRVGASETSLRISARSEKTIKLKAKVLKKMKTGEYAIGLRLVSRGKGVMAEKSIPITYTGAQGEIVVQAIADAAVRKGAPKNNYGKAGALFVDGGNKEMEDDAYAIVFLKFRLEVPGKPLSGKLRLQVSTTGYAQSRDSGCVYAVKGEWDEKTITYENKPALGEKVGVIGKIENGERIERDLNIDLDGRKEVSLAIVPTSCDGASYLSREGGSPPELIVRIGPR
ncbi:MAG: PQQ-binding-like beta-propeller repeat protein [Planctomycetes bacterium]|nr:PQQ-binding-like beta-propeller repeat protein [Planctomycetota bacterium]